MNCFTRRLLQIVFLPFNLLLLDFLLNILFDLTVHLFLILSGYDGESGFLEGFFSWFIDLLLLLLLWCLQMWSPNESNIIQHLDSFISQPTLPALISVRPLCTLVHDPPWQFSIGWIAVWDAAMSVLHTKLFWENRQKLDVVFLDLIEHNWNGEQKSQ